MKYPIAEKLGKDTKQNRGSMDHLRYRNDGIIISLEEPRAHASRWLLQNAEITAIFLIAV